MKQSLASSLVGILGACAATALAGTIVTEPAAPIIPTTNAFENARRPISNPTLFDLALPSSNVHAIFMYQNLSNSVATTIGAVPMGGDMQVYALQLEWALTERLSLVATKDGYVDFKPDANALWSNQTGFANIAGGVKYAFIYDPVKALVVSGTATLEFPTGNHKVFQGEGDGSINLILSGLKMWDRFQLATGGGFSIPFDSQLSSRSFLSAHVSYEVKPWFIPLAEVNWHHVISTGNGRPNFFRQVGGAVPVVATFEGFDLLNFGSSNASRNRDFVSAAFGFRSRVTPCIDLGFAYELPLTDKKKGIMDNRFTVDFIWRF